MSRRAAAVRYGVSRTTIKRYLEFVPTVDAARVAQKSPRGHPTILTNAEEELIVTAVVASGEYGFGRDKVDILSIVQDFVTTMGRPNPFKNGKPGEDWFLNWLGETQSC